MRNHVGESVCDAGGGGLRMTTLLPIVRAAMARGEGPPAVIAWVQAQGHAVGRWGRWSEADEFRARFLARRLAAALNHRGSPDADTGWSERTLAADDGAATPSR